MPPSKQQKKIDKNLVTRRTAMLGFGGVGVFGILGARLYQLQVLQAEDYRGKTIVLSSSPNGRQKLKRR